MKEALRAYYRARQFEPRISGLWLTPFFLARRALWTNVRDLAGELTGRRLLDVGCGTKPYRRLFDVAEYVGMDIDSPVTRQRGIADVVYDGMRFPFDDGRFDAILCNQVLEHVFTPDAFVAELARMLAPGGKLLLSVPFVWDEHEQPWDYARYSSFGLRSLLERHGFRIVHHRKLLDDPSMLFQLANAYLFKVLRTRSAAVNVVLTALVAAPVSALGMLAGWLLPRNPDLFLDQVVLAERLP